MLAGCQSSTGETPTGTPTATPTPTETPTTPTATAAGVDPAALKDRARSFVRLLADGEYGSAHDRFTDGTAAQISAEQLGSAWQQRTDTKGAFTGIASAEYRGQSDGVHVVVLQADFERGQQQAKVALTADGVTGFRLPQGGSYTPPDYVDRSAFTERTLSLSAPGSCSLGATLSVPTGSGSVPGVVLVHGNGAQDRDETVGPNRTFRDLAWGLATNGVAVLRYDKRTHACDVDLADATIDDVVTVDALTAIDRIRETDRVARDGVFVVGHSIGGTLAPRIARRDADLAGVVMLAALARPIADAIVDQQRYLLTLDGFSEDDEQTMEQVRGLAERIRTLDIPDDRVVNGFGGDEYYRTLREYDHLATAASLDVPRLLLQGERDWQVTVEDDLAMWRSAMGDQPDVTIRTYPQLTHHFMPGEGEPTRQEYFEPNNVAETVVTDVAQFVTTHA
jgi:hypothetical protein